MSEQASPATIDRNAPPVDRYVFEIDGGAIVLVCVDCGARSPNVKGLNRVQDVAWEHNVLHHRDAGPHNPNACCDFHRNIADGCCHCGDDVA